MRRPKRNPSSNAYLANILETCIKLDLVSKFATVFCLRRHKQNCSSNWESNFSLSIAEYSKLSTDPDDDDVEDVPDGVEVADPVLWDLDELLGHVVEDEADVDDLAGHDEVVEGCDVAEQLDRLEAKGRHHAARRRELEDDPSVEKI